MYLQVFVQTLSSTHIFQRQAHLPLTDGNCTSKRNKGARLLTDESVRQIKFEAAMTKQKKEQEKAQRKIDRELKKQMKEKENSKQKKLKAKEACKEEAKGKTKQKKLNETNKTGKVTIKASASQNEPENPIGPFCDENYMTSALGSWIRCQKCLRWMHGSCSGAGEEDATFICDFCKYRK